MASITISNIRFADGDPCRPLYPDLYEFPVGGQLPVQVEPAFQIGDGIGELSVELDLDEGSDVEFTLGEEGRPVCWEINGERVLDLEGSSSSCVFIWRRDETRPRARAFRIYCQSKSAKPTDEVKVHGGLFLAFITATTGQMGREILPHQLPAPNYRDIVLLGSDENHRPLYDVHRSGIVLPEQVEIEPAFRVREGRPLDFNMQMGILYAVWQEDLKFIQPEYKPVPLSGSYSPDEPTAYRFHWHQKMPRPCQKPEDCYSGKVVAFHLQPTLPPEVETNAAFLDKLERQGWALDQYRRALQEIGVDPTIIQPPPCDPFYQVCYRDLAPTVD